MVKPNTQERLIELIGRYVNKKVPLEEILVYGISEKTVGKALKQGIVRRTVESNVVWLVLSE